MGSYINTNGMSKDKAAWMNDFCRGQEFRSHAAKPLSNDLFSDAFRAGYTNFGKNPLPLPKEDNFLRQKLDKLDLNNLR
jgi:hypothetical protein